MAVPCSLHIALLLCWALVVFEPPGLYCQEPTASSLNLTYSLTIPQDDYEAGGVQQQAMASPDGAFVLKFGATSTQPNPHSLTIVHAASSTVVWYTYRPDTAPGQYDNLGGSSSTLRLQSDGDLAITVSGAGVDVLVWHSATSGKGVRTMELRANGNLALLNSSKGIVWQSFDHPVDTLLLGQRLLPGASLLQLATNKFPSVGRNILTLEASRLVSYVVYVEAEPYWELKGAAGQNLAYARIVNKSLCVFDEQDIIVGSVGNVSTGPGDGVLQRLLLDIDGNIRLSEFSNVTNSWSKEMQVIEEACALPDDCGSYGQCVPGQECACPQSFDLLATINGCVPPEDFDCTSRYGADFVKVPHASYFALPLLSLPSLAFDDCKGRCTSNCSCLGFFYSPTNGSCFITHQMRTFSSSVYNNYTDKYAYDVYVRVQGKPRSPLAIILGVCIPIAVIIFCVLLWLFVRNRVKVAHAEEEEFLLEALPGLPPRYSYKELKSATKGFSQRLGAGSFGSVYEGVLPDGTKVAVKQLEGAMQGKKEFHAEVATIGTVRHLNLVRLRGFCLQRHHRLLVYEHMKGSLDILLFRREYKQRLSWPERLRVAIGVARGLAYLHEGTPDCIIHCDIKPENVLVGEDGEAKLSDFGLAKLMSRKLAYVETMVRGTRGYMAPEWWKGRAQISEKADVYSYGVLLLEILSGRRNFDGPAESSKCYLPDWALKEGVGALQEMVDPSLTEDPDTWQRESGEVERALLVALWCLQEDPEARPAMSRVARMLEGDADVATPPASIQDDAFSSAPPSPMAFNLADRAASSEVALPFLRRASRFLFSSNTSSQSSSTADTGYSAHQRKPGRPSPLSSVY